jgi:hypothetical protein
MQSCHSRIEAAALSVHCDLRIAAACGAAKQAEGEAARLSREVWKVTRDRNLRRRPRRSHLNGALKRTIRSSCGRRPKKSHFVIAVKTEGRWARHIGNGLLDNQNGSPAGAIGSQATRRTSLLSETGRTHFGDFRPKRCTAY